MDPILDHPVVAERYFFPREAPIPDPTVVEVDGASLHCHRHAPEPARPTLLHFHGNGEVVADWLPEFAPAAHDRGLNTFFAEYRGYGGSTGAPALAAMLDDALAVAKAANVPPEKLVIYGRSVGSLYALHVAAAIPEAKLVLESGISDVRERLALRLRPEEIGATAPALAAALAARFDHRAKLAAHRGPVLVLHTHRDHLVSVDHGRQLAEWAGDRAELVLFDRGDHNTIHAHNGDAILDAVAALAHRPR